jgi:UDP-N-acetylglucosamine 2-epimerase (non-hydrolysing)
MASLKLLIIAGARPNFMKVAPIIQAAAAHNSRARNGEARFDCRLVHTGQHYDQRMSDVFFQELGIPAPDVNLGVGSGSHAAQTARIMVTFEPVCEAERPDWVVVVGDVNSTLACTLVASKLGIKVAHVEAGLRSFDRTMPEEINRLVTDSLADLLLTPSEDADANLLREGVAAEKIRRVGNVMMDTLLANLPQARARELPKALGLAAGGFAYVTLHRPSNVDDGENLRCIMTELRNLSRRLPVVFPIHPRTRKMCQQFGISLNEGAAFRVLDPIGYHDSLCLAGSARLVLTDSGGLQEESTFFRTPCLTLRPNTERPVTITIGSNRLTTITQLRRDFEEVLRLPERIGNTPPLWDGRASERILRELAAASEARKQKPTAKETFTPTALAPVS